MKNLFRALFCVCVVALWCCTHAPFSASAAEENLENLHMEMKGNSKLFSIDLDKTANVVIFYAEYPASRALASYHTTGWYVTKEPTNNVSNIPKENKYYINVGKKPEPVNGSTHDYREDYSLGISFDTHKFSAKDVRGMLEKLFGENEDLTKPHTVYLQDVFVKKSRSSETAGWTYDWSGKQYSSLDEFLTMYDSYRNNPGMREQKGKTENCKSMGSRPTPNSLEVLLECK